MAATIGKRLGELHVVMASPTDDPAFSPEPASQEDVASWVTETQTLLTEALDILERHLQGLDRDGHSLAEQLLARREKLLKAVGKIVGKKARALRTRIHGDFHLGQVLVGQLDAYLIDFEGEPARPVDERRRKMSPFRDVAGLLRSLSYAGAAAMPSEATALPANDRRRVLLESFSAHARERFMQAYRHEIASAPTPLADAATEGALIDLFLVEKAAYEIRYEAANRPSWLILPVRGLSALAGRLLGDTNASAASDVEQG
jgi:maltose alpha-D-glucosyltransferase/alpha-amylase